ncbi:Serine/threonine-protein kinase PAK 7 [Monoraphidium neglectum]|uniref:Serine/threonine-protein kinase PAK 7 n=1 Tax=Monoraphidium neglectum TaxID=145388 RepID=A0A0D2M955_9CHLO|nr:Serine/threonine-protein kinase PAK 7 [Monoraphidium neglectum]KIY99809.1 Serine/threonine-protein kinase PAK 7 [Monoraphidium neglectum]|eukprot:XP_013898829.1 Serine/threonine-protein kinase PAK 7 [Monoraphidium neglectum]
MFAPQPGGSTYQFAKTIPEPPPPPQSVSAPVRQPGANWTLCVYPARGWVPEWRAPMVSAVVVSSVLTGLLVCAVLVGRREEAWLLAEMRDANEALAEEKQRTDVLLARQLNLLSCALECNADATGTAAAASGGAGGGARRGGGEGEGGGEGGGGAWPAELIRLGSGSDIADSGPLKALAQIEDMRRAIGTAAPPDAAVNDLRLLELLGEGAFGKVYRGLWRGSTVAVKSMVLPANMSGAQKRERMAIMEAAISSAMKHPNIVQTFTYSIKPATSSTTIPSAGLAGRPVGPGDPGGALSLLSSSQHIHSFEVSIVLEYCDWGCLRDALDAGAFFTADNALNYAAILDTAADVARALLHLHRHQVVHSDLKSRNILLKSDGRGSAGRGAIAKVADFGLAVQVEAQSSHVSSAQGTPSHMAPEAQLGRVSTAADVYSFGVTLWEM